MRYAALFSFVAACASQTAPIALDEPLRARGAQFLEGALPAEAGGPRVTLATTQNPVILSGQGAKLLAGRAGNAASSIAVRFPDVGSGYWVFPLGPPDPQYPGELTWSVTCDFAGSAPPGPRLLAFAAIDGAGRAGPVTTLPMCFGSSVPDNRHACDPGRPVPAAVLSLSWDVDVDLDLVVVAPDGREISAKAPPIEGMRVDRDSLGACTRDGLRAEHLVFDPRPSGRFAIYASLFDACGAPTVRFTLDTYEAQGGALVRTASRSGRLLDLDANGGRDRGLFLAEHVF